MWWLTASLALQLAQSAPPAASSDAGVRNPAAVWMPVPTGAPPDGVTSDPKHPKPFVFDVPDTIDVLPMVGEERALGVPVTAEAVRTRAKPRDLLLHFIRRFRDAGFFIPPPNQQFQADIGGYALTGLDCYHWIGYTVIFQPGRDNTTVVFLTKARLDERTPPPSQTFVPVPPNSRGVLQYQSEGLRTLSFVAPMNGEDVLAYYKATLPKAGFHQEKDGTYVRGTDRLAVSATTAEDGSASVSVMAKRATAILSDTPAP